MSAIRISIFESFDRVSDDTMEFCAKVAEIMGISFEAMRDPVYRKACADVAAEIRAQKGIRS